MGPVVKKKSSAKELEGGFAGSDGGDLQRGTANFQALAFISIECSITSIHDAGFIARQEMMFLGTAIEMATQTFLRAGHNCQSPR